MLPRPTGHGHLIIDYPAKDLGLTPLNPYLDEGADFLHSCTGSTSPGSGSPVPRPSTPRCCWLGEGSPALTPTALRASSCSGDLCERLAHSSWSCWGDRRPRLQLRLLVEQASTVISGTRNIYNLAKETVIAQKSNTGHSWRIR